MLTPEGESEAIGRLLREWAVRSSLDSTATVRRQRDTLPRQLHLPVRFRPTRQPFPVTAEV